MRSIITLLLLSIPFTLLAQDWSWFPKDQGSYYKHKFDLRYEWDEIVYSVADSIKTESQEKTWYFNTKYLPDSIKKCAEPKRISSVLQRNDTLFYKKLHFLTKSKPGDSWHVSADKFTNLYDSVKITFEKQDYAEFLGLKDSVQVYQFELIGLHPDSTNIDDLRLRVSKNYGLIEYISFDILSNRNRLKDFRAYNIVGIEGESLQIGYRQKGFREYLPTYSPGDILFWKNVSGHFLVHYSYDRDSITRVVQNQDSLYYEYDLIRLNTDNEVLSEHKSLTKCFVFKEYEHIVTAKPNQWGFGKGNNYQLKNEDKTLIWLPLLNLQDFNTDQSIFMAYSSPYNAIIDIDSCSQSNAELHFSFELDSEIGIKSYGAGDGEFSSRTELIGSILNGVEEGILGLIRDEEMEEELDEETDEQLDEETGEQMDEEMDEQMEEEMNEETDEELDEEIEEELDEEMDEELDEEMNVSILDNQSEQLSIELYPNPTNHFININYSNRYINKAYKIFDMQNKLIKQGKLTDNQIDVTDLKTGIYFFTIRLGEINVSLKFIKYL